MGTSFSHFSVEEEFLFKGGLIEDMRTKPPILQVRTPRPTEKEPFTRSRHDQMEMELRVVFEILYLDVCIVCVLCVCVTSYCACPMCLTPFYYLDGATLLFSPALWGAGKASKDLETCDSLCCSSSQI